jgi:hypothetical protein
MLVARSASLRGRPQDVRGFAQRLEAMAAAGADADLRSSLGGIAVQGAV